ncbi:MAG: hypothetical protein KIH63_002600 [Candidatus Saccharibacteria bacterium]|nr:hypothetical protein [Candidatus Saccharibacteria bacterium]
MAGEFIDFDVLRPGSDGATSYDRGEKPRTAFELGVIAGDTVLHKLQQHIPIEPVVVQIIRTPEGRVEIPQTDLNIGLALGLEATDNGDITINGVVGAIKRVVKDQGKVTVTAINSLDDYTPEDLNRLTPKHPDVVRLGCEPPVPAIMISVEPLARPVITGGIVQVY